MFGITAYASGSAQQPGAGEMFVSFLPMIIILVVFYFLMIVPQKKRDKQMRAMLDALVVGDEIMTIGGIYGKIVNIKDDTVTIESGADKNKIKIAKNAIKECLTVHE